MEHKKEHGVGVMNRRPKVDRYTSRCLYMYACVHMDIEFYDSLHSSELDLYPIICNTMKNHEIDKCQAILESAMWTKGRFIRVIRAVSSLKVEESISEAKDEKLQSEEQKADRKSMILQAASAKKPPLNHHPCNRSKRMR
ncbi:hypothetical protein LXL04_037306 [Taraxacum kok-saghyz]